MTPQTQVYDSLDAETQATYPDEATLAKCDVYYDLQDMASTYDQMWTSIMAN